MYLCIYLYVSPSPPLPLSSSPPLPLSLSLSYFYLRVVLAVDSVLIGLANLYLSWQRNQHSVQAFDWRARKRLAQRAPSHAGWCKRTAWCLTCHVVLFVVWILFFSFFLCWYRHLSFPQRQMLRAVPVSEIHYEWKDCNSRFWVYGHDKKVHAPDYPQKCCCGCVIIWELHARPLITTAVDVDEIGGFQHLVCISVAVLGRKKYVLTIALSNYWRRIT